MFEKTKNYMSDNNLDGILIKKSENLFYFTGFSPIAGGYFLIKSEGSKLLVPELEFDAAKEESSVEVSKIDGFEDLLDLIGNYDKIGVERDLSLNLVRKIEEETDIIDVSDHIGKLRRIKTSEEIEKIRKASNISVESMEKGIESTERGKLEFEIAAEIEYHMRKNGAEVAFDTIVASGKRSALPHGVASDKKIDDGPVTFDIGAKYQNYCSDITRTILINPSEEMEEIYEVVLEAQKESVKQAEPGMKASELDKVSRDIIEDYGFGDRYYHSLGHGVGLDVHEEPKVGEGSEIELKPGMIITIEPGIYLKDKGGVRIEDTVVVTEDGVERLTKMERDLR